MSISDYWEEIGLTLGGLSAGIAGALKIKKPASPGKGPELEKMKKDIAEHKERVVKLETNVENLINYIREDRKEARERDSKLFNRVDGIAEGLARLEGKIS